MNIQDIAYQIEHLKLLRVLDWAIEDDSWYEAELYSLQSKLKELLKKK